MIRNPIQTYRTDATICILQSVWVRMYSPPCRGADGVVAHKLHFALRLERWRVSDHPVCGASVAPRLLFISPPPLLCKEGNARILNSSLIRYYFTSPVL